MSLQGLDRVPPPEKDPEESWRTVLVVSYSVPAMTLMLLAIGLLLRPEQHAWAEVRFNVALFAVLGVAGLLIGPIYVRATMMAALDAFAKRHRRASEGTVAMAIAPLLVAQVAACELPSLLGFVAYILGAPLLVYLVFVAVSFAGYAYFVPRKPQWDGWIARARPPQEMRVERL